MRGQPGSINRRLQIDQTQTVAWAGNLLRVPFNSLRQVGYLRGLHIQFPHQTITATLAGTGDVFAAGYTEQLPAFRAIQQFQVLTQGIAPIYNLTRGFDLFFLAYVGQQRWNRYQGQANANQTGGTLPPNVVGGTTQGQTNNYEGWVSAASQQGAGPYTQVVNYGNYLYVPLTEYIRFPGAQTKDSSGNLVSIAEQEVEVGLLTLQNTQQNVSILLQLNPLWQVGTLGQVPNSPFQVTTAAPSAGTINMPVSIYDEFYDVPADPADQPPMASMAFIVQRTSRDIAIAGGNATYTFSNAGFLMRSIYCFMDQYDNLCDVSNVQGDQIVFQWGAGQQKIVENAAVNLARAHRRYYTVPPVGALFHDFFEMGNFEDLVNTAQLVNVTSQITGYTSANGVTARGSGANPTTLHVIEERLIPLMPVGAAPARAA